MIETNKDSSYVGIPCGTTQIDISYLDLSVFALPDTVSLAKKSTAIFGNSEKGSSRFHLAKVQRSTCLSGAASAACKTKHWIEQFYLLLFAVFLLLTVNIFLYFEPLLYLFYLEIYFRILT